MKKILCTALVIFFFTSSWAQVPQQINYQGVARNSVGTVIANQNITLRLSIRDGVITGPIVYRETRNLTTNGLGLFTTAIGSSGATGVTGSFNTINWGSGPKFLQVEIDPTGQFNFIDMGTSQLLSVPYSIYAGSAGAAPPVGTAGGDLQGSYPSPTLKDNSITTNKIDNGSVTAAKMAPGVIPTTLPPSGSAGGVLNGNYPNPGLANGVVTNAQLADNAISTTKVQDASITAAKLAPGVIPSALPAIGNAGGDLSGTYPDPSIRTGAVDNAKLADGSVSTTKIADASVTDIKLADNAVTNSKLNDNAVSTTKIQDASVTTQKIQDASVTDTKLADNAVTNTKLADGSVSTTKIIDASVTDVKLADNAVTNTKLNDNAVSTSKLQDASVTAVKLAPGVIPSALPPSGTAGGDLTGSYPNPTVNAGAINNTKLADGSVSTTKIIDASVTDVKLANNAVTNTKLNDNAVSTTKLQDASVTAVKLAPGVIPSALPPSGTAGGDLTGSYPNPTVNAGAINNTKLADGSVSTTKIVDASVTDVKLADNAVTNTKLNDNAVSTTKIQNASVTAIKLAPGVIPTALPPTGTAGGDLTGSYPNPTVNAGAINNTKLADGSVSTTKIVDASVTDVKLADNAVSTIKIQDGAITATKLAPGVIPSALPPTGTAGGDLTGSYPNPTVNAGAINNTKLADGSVSTTKIVDASVTDIKLADNAVTNTKLTDNAVSTTKIQDGAITATKLAPGVIPSALPPSGSAGGDLGGSYPNPSVVKLNGISLGSTAPTSGQILKFDGTQWVPGTDFGGSPSGAAGGDLTGSYPNPTITASAVDNTKLADNAVGTSKIQDASVTAAKLAPGVIPTSMTPSGTAGGDLTGTYPNPTITASAVDNTKLADNAVSTTKIQDASATAAKLAPGVIPTSLTPSGTAGGDLTGTYPNPTIALAAIDDTKLKDNSVTTPKIQDASVTAAKLAAGVIPTALPPIGTAGGDLSGSYPNPVITASAVNNTKLADNAVSTTKIQDASVTAAKLAAGVIPTALPPTGTAGGDLSGSYPNPVITASAVNNTKLADNAVSTTKIQDASVTSAKLAAGVIPTALPPIGTAGGDLSGSYPNPVITASAVNNTKLADYAVSTTKIQDASVTAAKLAAGVIPTTLPPSGTAGGDLGGNYPNPSVLKLNGVAVGSTAPASGQVLKYNGTQWAPATDNSGGSPTGAAGGDLTGSYPNPAVKVAAIDSNKLAVNSVSTSRIVDASVTAAKLAPGVIPAALPPTGTAGGDLSGTYPNPSVVKLYGVPMGNTAPSSGQILKFDGTQWVPGTDSGGSPTGSAGGDLSGNYPNPNIASGAVTNSKIANGAVITPKIADGAVTNAKLMDLSVSTAKVQDGSITAAKLAPGAIPSSTGVAGGDLTGSYPNPTIAAAVVNNTKLADNAVSTTKIQDASVTAAKLAPGVIPTSMTPSGTAGGDLGGSYPNPSVLKLNGVAVGSTAPSTGQVLKYNGTQWVAGTDNSGGSPTGAAGGDLTGTYPNPTIAAATIDNTKLADNAVSTTKIQDASVTAAKLAPGVIPTSMTPSGTAGGDLGGSYPNPSVLKLNGVAVGSTAPSSGQVLKYNGTQWVAGTDNSGGSPTGAAGGDLTGTYPNPTIAAATVDNTKLADNAVSTTKIQDASVTAAKLAPGVIPTSMTPSGTAGGDLTGTYPNPTITAAAVDNTKLADNAVSTTKIQDASVTAAKLAPGVIPSALPPTGTAGGDLGGTYPNPSVLKLNGVSVGSTAPASGQVLKFNGTQWVPGTDNGGSFSLPYSKSITSLVSPFKITNLDTAAAITGLDSSSGGKGILGSSVNGTGLYGYSSAGNGIFGTSDNGTAGYFDISNSGSFSDALYTSNSGWGNGLVAIGTYNNGVLGVANDVGGAGVFGANNAGGEGVVGRTYSNTASAVVGRNDGTYAGVKGMNGSDNGIGVQASANVDGAVNGTALVAEIEGSGTGNPAVFKANGLNVARIDETGKGFFNGGTQVGGADVAEYFDVAGSRTSYEPGDVLVISQDGDRMVEKSTGAYSTLVAGVFATKPGLMLTEKNAEHNQLDQMVPMGVIGVIPTKVCLEGGPIKRGDLIVTSSIPGVAMKADPEKVKVGQVIGKALQDYNAAGVGKINVLVSVK